MRHQTSGRIKDRRAFLSATSSLCGLGLIDLLSARDASASSHSSNQSPASVIVLFAWGGLSHLDTFDLKPNAGSDVRSQFQSISTTVPGLQVSEHLPHLARLAHELTVVRSVRHGSSDHRFAAYWNITGRSFETSGQGPAAGALPPSRKDWPCLGSLVEYACDQRERQPRLNHAGNVLPRHFSIPYPIADRGIVNGQYGGFLGAKYDPIFMKPKQGNPYAGVSPATGHIDLAPPVGIDDARRYQRSELLRKIEQPVIGDQEDTIGVTRNRQRALELMTSRAVRDAFDLSKESPSLHQQYGQHVCGQSVLLARRLTEAGVPLVTVNCAAGDLNGSVGAHFDTHANNFNRLKDQMLPPLDQAMSALITDLKSRGRLDSTLIVLMTEFGRTPKINGAAGRDHYPNCYSVVFAGAGVKGGHVYGESDSIGAVPLLGACKPADLHATIFEAMKIDPQLIMYDLDNRPLPICDGSPLPIFS